MYPLVPLCRTVHSSFLASGTVNRGLSREDSVPDVASSEARRRSLAMRLSRHAHSLVAWYDAGFPSVAGRLVGQEGQEGEELEGFVRFLEEAFERRRWVGSGYAPVLDLGEEACPERDLARGVRAGIRPRRRVGSDVLRLRDGTLV